MCGGERLTFGLVCPEIEEVCMGWGIFLVGSCGNSVECDRGKGLKGNWVYNLVIY